MEKADKGAKGASNVMVNVTVNVDPEVATKVLVDVLKDADIVKNYLASKLADLAGK